METLVFPRPSVLYIPIQFSVPTIKLNEFDEGNYQNEMSKLVNDSGYKVVVTGEEAKVRRFIAENPDSPENISFINQLYPWMERAPGNTPAFARAFFGKDLDLSDPALSHRPRWNTSSAIKGLFNPDFKMEADTYNSADALLSKLPENFQNWKNLNQAQWF